MAPTYCLGKPIWISASSASGDSRKTFSRREMVAMAVSLSQTSLQINCRGSQKLRALDGEHVSRRKSMLHLTTGVIGGFFILSSEAAEARIGRQENRRKALEKLRERNPKSVKQKKERSSPPASKEQPTGPLVEASLVL